MTPPPKTRDPNLDWSTARPINVADLDFSTAEAINPGEQINDVGNRVIVPDEGESFASTLQRAAAYGKTVTQEQINKEMATAPRKVATVLAAAPVIGAAIPAAEAGFGELMAPTHQVVQKGAGFLLQQVEQARRFQPFTPRSGSCRTLRGAKQSNHRSCRVGGSQDNGD